MLFVLVMVIFCCCIWVGNSGSVFCILFWVCICVILGLVLGLKVSVIDMLLFELFVEK